MFTSITLLIIAQASCEWVEISQQHYQKPLRITHNHPSLATVGKVNDVERTTKANRVYINHSLSEYNWNTALAPKRHDVNVNSEQLDSSTVSFNSDEDTVLQKPTQSNELIPKGNIDVAIIRKAKPEVNGAVKQSNVHRIPIAGNVVRVRPVKDKEPSTKAKPESSAKGKPPDEFTGAIEVLNMSDLDYITEDEGGKNTGTNNRKQIIATPINKVKPEQNTENYLRRTSLNNPFITRLKGSNMRRVEIISSTKPTPQEHHNNTHDRLSKPQYLSTPPTKFNNEELKTVYTFPNIGQIKRVQLDNSSIKIHRRKPDTHIETSTISRGDSNAKNKEEFINQVNNVDKTRKRVSPSENISVIKINKVDKKNFANNRPDIIVSPEEIMVEEILSEELSKEDIIVHKVASVGNVKRVFRPKEDVKDLKNRQNGYRPIKPLTEPPLEDNNDEVIVEDDEPTNILNRDFSDDDTSSTEKVFVFTTAKIKPTKNTASKTEEIRTQIESYERNPFGQNRPSQETIPEFVTKQEHFNVEPTERNKERTSTETETSITKATYTTYMNQFSEKEDKYSNSHKKKTEKGNINQEMPKETISGEPKPSAMENLIKFLKTVTNIISRNTRKGVGGKLRYLEDLRDTILANIEERIEAAFPDDGPRRRGRSAEPRGHVEFPSSESALMTISFLTFAVFLIKLVLQVIQAYKNKTMMVMPTMVAAVGKALNDYGSNNG